MIKTLQKYFPPKIVQGIIIIFTILIAFIVITGSINSNKAVNQLVKNGKGKMELGGYWSVTLE